MTYDYRGIRLMPIAAKVYNRILLNRIKGPIDELLCKNQAGFRTGRSCVRRSHILRCIIDGAYSDRRHSTLRHYHRLQEGIPLHRQGHDVRHPGADRELHSRALRPLDELRL